MSESQNPEVRSQKPELEAKVFVLTIKYAKGTRWLINDEIFTKGLTRQVELLANMDTEGPLPIVTVTEGKL